MNICENVSDVSVIVSVGARAGKERLLSVTLAKIALRLI